MSDKATCDEDVTSEHCMIRLYRDDCPGQLSGKCTSSKFNAINGDEYFPAHFYQKQLPVRQGSVALPGDRTHHLTPEEAYAGMLEMERAGGLQS